MKKKPRNFTEGKIIKSKSDYLTIIAHMIFHETEFSRILCKALREWCNTDCAIINAGLILGPLSGKVTVYDLLIICPHPINPCKVQLTGKELKEIY